jgi:hypothetical protein
LNRMNRRGERQLRAGGRGRTGDRRRGTKVSVQIDFKDYFKARLRCWVLYRLLAILNLQETSLEGAVSAPASGQRGSELQITSKSSAPSTTAV